MFWTQKTRPLAREEGLLIEDLNDEIVVFDTKSREAHCLGPLAAVVFAHSDGRTSTEGLAAVASERLNELVEPWQVEEALDQLQERGLLSVVARRLEGGTTRRQALKRSAVAGGAVVAAPLVTSVFPPAAAAAGSATCGAVPGEPGPTVLCCPCTTNNAANKDECCQPPFANTCNCTSAQGDTSKFCHPVGQASGHDATCAGGGRPPCEQCCLNQTAAGNVIADCGVLHPAAAGHEGDINDPGNCVGACTATCLASGRCVGAP